MNNKRKAELEESLSSALEPPRKRQIARLDSILADYIDPRDVTSLPREHQSESKENLVLDAGENSNSTIAQDTMVEHQTTEEQQTTQASPTTLVHHSTIVQETSPVIHTSLVRNQGKPKNSARVVSRTTLARETTDEQYAIVEAEYTKTPNDLWDEIMPTLDPYDQTVLWQLYRLSRGYHRDTCTIGFPRLATRCNISPKQAQISVGRLEKRGLISRLGSDFGNRNVAERGNIYQIFLPEGREAPRPRVVRATREAPTATVVPDTIMKLNTQNESTQTQGSAGVGSKFSLEECRRYADHLKHTGQGIINPGGYATKIFRSAEADALIEAFLNPQSHLDLTLCTDCKGSGFIYLDAENPDRGVKPCKHLSLKSGSQ